MSANTLKRHFLTIIIIRNSQCFNGAFLHPMLYDSLFITALVQNWESHVISSVDASSSAKKMSCSGLDATYDSKSNPPNWKKKTIK